MTHHPRKRFGQNFLQDPAVVFEILSAINPKGDEHVVEIGPGTGALTTPLLSRCGFLDIVEIDRDLAARLKTRFASSQNLNVVCEDVLHVNFFNFRRSDEKIRLIGNLPYNISTPLLFYLLDQVACIQDMHFMLQKEVVDRICAKPGGKAFGRLSIMMQFHFQTEKLFEVAPRSFKPQPRVHSALVRLTPRCLPEYSNTDFGVLKTVVTQAFSQRRKTLRNALSGHLSADELAAIGVDPAARAETIDIAAYIRLSEVYRRKIQVPD
ncbi:MAG: 16S rRNA (adenine(1518)-N(6)/adenine(1519)-N(6))-dimethyltransferase RsmA, partial [Methylococcales bacterium]